MRLRLDDQDLQPVVPVGGLVDPAEVDPGERLGTGIGAQLVDPVRRGEADDASCPRRAPPATPAGASSTTRQSVGETPSSRAASR